MAVVLKQFEAEYGFKSPGFTVDNAGNVVVRTITNTYTPPVVPPAPDFNTNETAGAFTWLKDGNAVSGNNPNITLERGKTYNFVLNLSSLTFNIFQPDVNDANTPGDLYSTGLSHQNVVTGSTLASGSITVSQTWAQQQSGYDRTAQVLVPDTTGTALAGKKIPILIVLHDTNETQGQGIAKVNWVNDRILIAPQGYGNEWNVGYQTSKANDVALIDSIIASLDGYDNVDTREIAIVGFGNGAQLALQYANYTQNASVKHIITYNGLLHEDQYLPAGPTFYNYTLDPQNTDNSTIVNWSAVTPLSDKKVTMFNGKNELNYVYNGGTYQNQVLYSAVDTIYAMAQADSTIDTKETTGVQQPDSSELISYNSGNIRLFSYLDVANNFANYQNNIRSQITTQIAVSSYINIPVSTTLTGAEAQGKQSGTLTYEVPVDAPDSLFYGDADGIPAGIITVAQPSLIGAGVFSSILNTGNFLNNGVNANVEIKPTGTGLVTIQPEAVGTISNMNVNAQQLTATNNVSLTPNADVTISPQAGGDLTIRPIDLGTVDNVTIGGVIPRNGTFSNIVSAQGTLNSTTIGLTTAASAAFTGATVTNDPSSANDVTKKQYVDNTATVLAIALGV